MSLRILSSAIALCALPQLVWARESNITRAALPPAVQRTVAEQSKGATIRGFSKEVEDPLNGKQREIQVGPNGEKLDHEE